MRKLFCRTISFFLSSAFVFSGCISAGAFEIRNTEPQRDEKAPEYIYYYSDENIFQKIGYGMANCTAYAWGRIFEILGEKPNLSTNNAGRWYTHNINNHIYSYGSVPKPGAVACWDKFDNVNGHVAVVEEVSDDRSLVTLSESQWNGQNFRSYEQTSDSTVFWRGYRFLGYIYPDDTSAVFYGDMFRIKSADEATALAFSEDSQLSSVSAAKASYEQNFRFEPLGDGSYRIWSASEDLVLSDNNGNVTFSEDCSTEASKWKIMKDLGGRYSICKADNPELVLSLSEGTAVVSEYAASDSQLWNLSRITGITPLEKTDRELVLTLDCTNARISYMTDEFLDLSDVSFMINGRVLENIDISKLNTFYDFSAAGETTITLDYDGLQAAYTVTVSVPPEGLEDTRNNAMFLSITKHLLETEKTEYSEEYDLNHDSIINSVDMVLSYAVN